MIKRRRTPAEVDRLRADLAYLVRKYSPVTVRQVFYLTVACGWIEKTEAEYKTTVCRLLADMRRTGEIDYRDVADNTRWMRKPCSYDSLTSTLTASQPSYRRSIWADQDQYVEIWLEKESLAGVLFDVTAKWDVPLMVTRGYPSLSFVYAAAESLAHEQRPCHLYYFGDRDPSGVDIPRFVEQQIRELAPRVDLTFDVVAVTAPQITTMRLPTRPTKKADPRSRNFKGQSVEVDAIEPNALRDLCRRCIESHIDSDALRQTRHVEQRERETLAKLSAGLHGGRDHVE